MLSNTYKLYFPKIIFDKAVLANQTTATDTPKPINLYRLDWSRKETKCSNNIPELNEYYESLLKSFTYAISDAYLKEIHRVSWNAPSEWNALRLLDTSLKHIYLKPASSYVEVALRLIADSAYDEELKFYYRGEHKKVLPYILLYKFWKNQVNSSLLFSFGKISEMITLSMNTDTLTEEESASVNDFLKYVNKELEVAND